MATAPREHFSTQTGFVLAAVGSAVGLGNMWRFAYLTAESGGGAFVLLYIVFTFLIGMPVLLAEFTIGRGSGKSPIAALVHYGGGRWRALGMIFVVAGFLILAYYSVIAGWTVRYGLEALVWGFPANPGDHFGQMINGTPAVLWHLVFMALTTVTVIGGVKGGIERAAIVLMPLLFALVVGLAVYAATLDGGARGYGFYLDLDMRVLLSWKVITNAAGQAFFSLSLGMGAMLTYASYLGRDSHLPSESVVVASADFGVAFIAGLAVFPMIFAFGLESDVGESTVGALFITLPKAFAEMGAVGRAVGVLFFIALLIGALTSAISLLEVVVAAAIDGFGMARRSAALTFGGIIALIGIFPALSDTVLGYMDRIAGNVLLVAGGALLAVFTGWVMRDPAGEVDASGWRWVGAWIWMLRVPVPIVLTVVLGFTVMGLVGC